MDQSSIELTQEQIGNLITSDIDLGYGMEPTLYVNLQKDVRLWCSENMKDVVELDHETSPDPYGECYLQVTLSFGSPHDAIFFKLRWL